MQKVVVELEVYDEKTMQKALKTVSGLLGIQLIQIEQNTKKLTVIGDTDPVRIVRKLRKHCQATIVSVVPIPEAKKEEQKKEEEANGYMELVKAYQAYSPYITTHYYVPSADEDPNSCVIC